MNGVLLFALQLDLEDVRPQFHFQVWHTIFIWQIFLSVRDSANRIALLLLKVEEVAEIITQQQGSDQSRQKCLHEIVYGGLQSIVFFQ